MTLTFLFVRFPCVLVGNILRKTVDSEADGTQGQDPLGNHRGGCDVVLPGYFHLPFRARDYNDFWTGECDDPLTLDYNQ